ncbi:hypothetical protein BO78DRAFT_178871 [Aspergillus sclerotiicarbonarius CBS 121057]|uniref:Uncharacterized protein n=1 Tax=Aspergillus sclerotiicarbonarius (strain CBS 121057 / IBT 28362) TaxID=1448318 RepID=A0A319EJX6_ASPSB|nr:hypothetical protein BO78DRAFT_178871 [Aspergillus sclerotiicarbonarius CBS 121057]
METTQKQCAQGRACYISRKLHCNEAYSSPDMSALYPPVGMLHYICLPYCFLLAWRKVLGLYMMAKVTGSRSLPLAGCNTAQIHASSPDKLSIISVDKP